MSETHDFCPKCGGEFACLCSTRTRKEVRERIANALRADPALPDTQHAANIGTTDKTVASVRRELLSNSEIPNCPRKANDNRLWRFDPDNREPDDFYSTPRRAILALLDRVKFTGNIWECACGLGHISKYLEMLPSEVISTDLRDRGYGTGGIDFLKDNRRVDNICTNPPFRKGLQFARHALDCAKDKVALLLPLRARNERKRCLTFNRRIIVGEGYNRLNLAVISCQDRCLICCKAWQSSHNNSTSSGHS